MNKYKPENGTNNAEK